MLTRLAIAVICLTPALFPQHAEAFETSSQSMPTIVIHPAPKPQPAPQFQAPAPAATAGAYHITQRTSLFIDGQPVASRTMEGTAVVSALSGSSFGHPVAGTPGSVGAVVKHQATDNLSFMGSYNFSPPSSFGAGQYDTGYRHDTFAPQTYGSSYSLGLGAEWQQTDHLSFRTGVQYDNTPAFSPQALQNDRAGKSYLAQLGARLNLGNDTSLDVAASHIFFKDGMMGISKSLTDDPNNDAQLQLKGKTFSHDNVIKVQVHWKFK